MKNVASKSNLALNQSLIFNPVFFFRRHFNIFCRLTEVLLQKYIKPTLKVSTLNWIEGQKHGNQRPNRIFFSRYTTYITIYSAYMILRSIWTVFKNAILHTKKGVKDISSHETFILFRFSSRLYRDLWHFITKVEFLNSKSTIDREKLEILVNTKYERLIEWNEKISWL